MMTRKGTMNWDRMIHRMLPSSMTVVGLRTPGHLAAPLVSTFPTMTSDEISLPYNSHTVESVCKCFFISSVHIYRHFTSLLVLMSFHVINVS